MRRRSPRAGRLRAPQEGSGFTQPGDVSWIARYSGCRGTPQTPRRGAAGRGIQLTVAPTASMARPMAGPASEEAEAEAAGRSPCQECHSAAYEPPAATSSSCEPELGDPAVLDDRDPVGVVGGVQPVRDRDDRPALQHGGQRALEVPGRPRVDQRGRLVEHQRVRVGDDQPGQRELLGLGRGQRRARPRRPSSVSSPSGSVAAQLQRVDRRQRRAHLVVRCVRAGPAPRCRAACPGTRGAPG